MIKLIEMKTTSLIMRVALTVLFFAASLALAKDEPDPCLAALTMLSRETVKSHFLNWLPVSSEENSQYLELVPSQSLVFLDIELAVLKSLNDTIADKDLVTSLLNFHKWIFFRKVEVFKSNHPNLRVFRYSNEKLSSLAIEGSHLKSVLPELHTLFVESTTEFAAYIQQANLLRATDIAPAKWFHAGLGETPDQANLAARYSRQKSSLPRIFNFADPEVRLDLEMLRQTLETHRKKLEQQISATSMWNGWTLSADAATATRKANSLEELRLGLSPYASEALLTEELLDLLMMYAKEVDEFSPSLRRPEKIIASLVDADHGGLSIDLVGFGGLNLRGTAYALHLSESVSHALVMARQAEHWATRRLQTEFRLIQSAARQAFGSSAFTFKHSGDDAVIVFTRSIPQVQIDYFVQILANAQIHGEPIVEELLKSLDEDTSPAAKRIAIVPQGVLAETRSEIAVHCELIEKILRKKLRSKLNSVTLKGLLFAVQALTTQSGHGPLHLLVGTDLKDNRTSIDQDVLVKSFIEAIKTFNLENGTNYSARE